MAPFEVLYERRYRTPLNWIEPGEKVIFGPDLVEEAEATIRCIKDNLKAAKSCQEASTFGVQSWKSCVFESFAHERHEEVWGKRKISTSLHRTIPHPQEVWNCGLQA
jgi:hypothetical protein